MNSTFDIENVLNGLLELEKLGDILITEKRKEFVTEYIGIFKDRSYLHDSTVFPYLRLIKRKTIPVLSGYDLFGWECTSDQTIALCCKFKGRTKLIIVDAATGKVINECDFPNDCKRFTYDLLKKTFYVSCNYIYSVRFDERFGQPKSLKNTRTDYSCGICIKDNYLYANIGTGNKKMNLYSDEGLQAAFSTNRSYGYTGELYALMIDYKNGRLIRASEHSYVASTSLEGKEIFSTHLLGITSVVVNSKGFIFAGNKNGYVYLIPEDGKEHRTLLNKCDKIKDLRDIWSDKSENTLFICGNGYSN